MLEKIQETAAFLKAKMHTHPETAIILGTGLGSLVHEITDKYEINYSEIPNFPVSTVEGHSGKLIFGKLGNKDIMAMQGRFHFYEGYSMKEVTFPVRVMRELGIKTLFVSNAAGGTNPDFEIGDLMIITDHINLFPEHPLRGKNIEYGPRFPDMSEAYSKGLIAKALEIAQEKGIKVQQGVYLGTQGPTFETPSEYKMFHILGADAVGMSTVPEVIVANHCGIKVFGVSVITDLGVEGKIVEVSHEEVQKAADEAQPRMTTIMRELINRAYSKGLIAKALEIAQEKGIKVQQGVYLGTQGPTFETPSEYKMFHILGADAVGMSTVPEVIVANHCGIKVFGVSVITDLGVEGKIVEVSHEEVQKAADEAQPRMTTIMRELINRA